MKIEGKYYNKILIFFKYKDEPLEVTDVDSFTIDEYLWVKKNDGSYTFYDKEPIEKIRMVSEEEQ